MRWFHFVLYVLGIFLWLGEPVKSQCATSGCVSSPLRCGPDNTTVPSCNSRSGQCYCLDYQCDNAQKNCSSTRCGVNERPECVLDRDGTRCKCISVFVSTYCRYSDYTNCNFSYINPADLQRFGNICGNLGHDFSAKKCQWRDECRCIRPDCTITGCASSSLRCGAEQPIPSCDVETQCHCLNYQCDNRLKNCSSMICDDILLEKPECVFDEHGTSCKCVNQLAKGYECRGSDDPHCTVIDPVNQADIQHYQNICLQLGSVYFANNCGREECMCTKKNLRCKEDTDCEDCPAGGVGTCDYLTQTCSDICGCGGNAACTEDCPAGQVSQCNPSGSVCTLGRPEGGISACGPSTRICTDCTKNCSSDSDCSGLACPADKPIGKCNSTEGCYCDARFQCNSNSDCPDCAGGLRKACLSDGTCTCDSRQLCGYNEECTRANGYSCSFPNIFPSCCWKDCDNVYTCGCRSGSLLECRNGNRGTESYCNTNN